MAPITQVYHETTSVPGLKKRDALKQAEEESKRPVESPDLINTNVSGSTMETTLVKQKSEVSTPDNFIRFSDMQKAVVAARAEKKGSAQGTLLALIDLITEDVFVAACKGQGYEIMRFLGPELDQDDDVKRVLMTLGEFVSSAILHAIMKVARVRA